MDKKDMVPIYNGILLSHKRNEIVSFADIERSRDCHTEVNWERKTNM